MSKKSLTKGKPVITHEQLISDLARITCISKDSVRLLLATLPQYILEQNAQGNAVRISRLATFTLRKRTYSEERRRTFKMANASLPDCCVYPVAQYSVLFRKAVKDNKDDIAPYY